MHKVMRITINVVLSPIVLAGIITGVVAQAFMAGFEGGATDVIGWLLKRSG